MDFTLTPAQAEIRRQVALLSRGFGWEYWREKDRKAEYPIEFVRAFADAGWLGLVIPEAYGGAGLGVTEAVLMLEAISASGAGLSGASPIHFAVFPPMPIMRHGSERLRRRVLPEIAAGRLSLAFGVTEPNAGTDTSRIQTIARRDGSGWIVSGRKVWTSNARHSQKMLLLARTTPYEAAGPRKLDGLTLFVADLDPTAVELREIEKLGRAAVDSNEVIIDGLRVADEDVVGEVGRGFYHLLDSLNPERVLVAGEAVGIGRVALERAAAYARERVVFGRPIGQNQAVAHPLALSWARLEAAWQLTLRAAWLFDRGEACGAEANAAKVLAAEAGFDAADAALQTLGGFGYAKEFDVERLWREVRLYKIAPVSQQMALNYLAERVLGLPKSY
ncbi:MAG TPA: acyl-CoA dehydrogenase family protein [Methylomirabilota bacterium]|nr:acyl-CoA dehydrogenase family protein [Methylomirabilota bacterium]